MDNNRVMKLEIVKEVRIASDEKDVNKLLKEKFLLIKIFQSKSNGDDVLKPVFVLAK